MLVLEPTKNRMNVDMQNKHHKFLIMQAQKKEMNEPYIPKRCSSVCIWVCVCFTVSFRKIYLYRRIDNSKALNPEKTKSFPITFCMHAISGFCFASAMVYVIHIVWTKCACFVQITTIFKISSIQTLMLNFAFVWLWMLT